MQRCNKSWLSILFKYISTYICISIFVMGALMPIHFAALNNEKKNKIEDIHTHLNNASNQLQERITKMEYFLQNLKNNQDVVRISLISNEEQSKSTYLTNIYYYLQDALYDNGMNAEMILQFTRNNVLLTSNRIFDDKETFYKYFFRYKDMTYDEWQEKLYLGKQFLWGSMDTIILNDTQKTAFTINRYYPSAVSPSIIASIVIQDDALWELFLTDDIKEYGFIYLEDPNSDIIASYNWDRQLLSLDEGTDINQFVQTMYIDDIKYTIFTVEEPVYGLTVIAGVQNSLYEHAILPTKKIIIIYTVAALVIAVLLSFIFAYLHYSPLKSIVAYIDTLNIQNKYDTKHDRARGNIIIYNDVYDYIETTVSGIALSKDKLRNDFSELEYEYITKIFKDAVLGYMVTEDEKTILLNHCSVLNERYLIMLVAFEDTLGEVASFENIVSYNSMIKDMIKECFEESYIYNIGNLCAVIGIDGNDDYKTIKDKLGGISKRLEKTLDLTMFFGLSTACDGMENINRAYDEALQCIAHAKSIAGRAIISYGEIPSTNSKFNVELSDYHLLFNLLMVGELNDIRDFFVEMSAKLDSNTYVSPKELQMIYYNTICVFLSVMQKLPIEKDIYIERYNARMDKDKLINQLCKTSIMICNAVAEQKDKEKLKLEKDILKFLNENFTNPDLSLTMIAEKFNISENYASQFVKEQTGKNYTQLVEELRMNEAQKLLEETAMPISEITSTVGYYSKNTFYKAFRRNFNIAPQAYRENFKNY